jgi:hypothetical protein
MYWISLEATWTYEKGFQRMSLWKIWSIVWEKIVVEEGLTKTWPRWTIHRRRASGSLGIKEPYVMKKGKWMLNPRNQAYYEESYITKCQSLLNQEMKWLGYQKWKLIMRCKVLQVTTSKGQCLSKIKCDNPHKVKRDEVTRFNFVQAQVEEMCFIFNLEYRLLLYQEGYHMDCQ